MYPCRFHSERKTFVDHHHPFQFSLVLWNIPPENPLPYMRKIELPDDFFVAKLQMIISALNIPNFNEWTVKSNYFHICTVGGQPSDRVLSHLKLVWICQRHFPYRCIKPLKQSELLIFLSDSTGFSSWKRLHF